MIKTLRKIFAALGFISFTVLAAASIASAQPPVAAAAAEYELLIQSQIGNVTDKDCLNTVELYGTYSNKGIFAKKIRLLVKDDNGNLLFEINPEADAGYAPSFTLGNFTEADTQQIFLGINSGGSGGFGFFYIYDVSGDKPVTLFDYAHFNGDYSAEYADGYKIIVTNNQSGRNYVADISYKGKQYLDQIYNADGVLKHPQTATVWPLNNVFPYFNAAYGRYQLQTFIPVSGLYHADGVGNIINFMRYADGRFVSYSETIALQ